jgi:hypothetical protein
MGSTLIDLEDRYFSQRWRDCDRKKPVERRSLWAPSSLFPQGQLSVLVEVLTAAEGRLPPFDKGWPVERYA